MPSRSLLLPGLHQLWPLGAGKLTDTYLLKVSVGPG